MQKNVRARAVVYQRCYPCLSIDACPIGALTRTESGVIRVIQEDCTGCGECVKACFFNAVKLDECFKPIFCDLCGGETVCARAFSEVGHH